MRHLFHKKCAVHWGKKLLNTVFQSFFKKLYFCTYWNSFSQVLLYNSCESQQYSPSINPIPLQKSKFMIVGKGMLEHKYNYSTALPQMYKWGTCKYLLEAFYFPLPHIPFPSPTHSHRFFSCLLTNLPASPLPASLHLATPPQEKSGQIAWCWSQISGLGRDRCGIWYLNRV